jgi:outer membrane protein
LKTEEKVYVSKKLLIWPAVALCTIAFGQSAPTKVGVINIQSAIVSTKDGQRAAQELETKRAPKAKEFEKRQTDIRQLQDQLNRGGSAMAETAKNELVRNIDTKTKTFNRDLEDAQAEWDQDQQKVLQELGQKMMVVIDKYAKDNSFSLILDVSNPQTPVLYASNTIDITKDIIDLYDKSAIPATAPAGAAKPGGAATQTAPPVTTAPKAPVVRAPTPAPPKK